MEREWDGQEYGSSDAWPFVEEGSTRLEEEEEEEEEKKKKALLRLEHHPQEEEQPEVGQKPPQHQEPAEDEAPPENSTAMSEVHNGVSAKTDSLGEGVEDPGFSKLPALQAVMPRPLTEGNGGTRRPCYGWISESDDE